MQPSDSVAETFDVTPVRSRAVLAPKVPAIAALAAARRAPTRRKKLKWRTRDSQASQLYNLELDVMGLRQEIQRLREYQQVLNARTFNRRDALDGYYVKAAMEYHRVFENGYRPGSPVDGAQFIKQAMAENVAIGRFGGREVLLHQWEIYTKALSGLEFKYLSSRVVSAERQTIVTSFASYKYTVTRGTLEMMFPNAMPRLAAKMLGRVLQGVGQFDFTFDMHTHCIVAFDPQLNFLQVFSHLLQDPSDLCALFEGATISEECLLGDVTCYEERRADQVPTQDREEKRASDFGAIYEDKAPAWGGDGGADEHRQPSLSGTGGPGLGHIME